MKAGGKVLEEAAANALEHGAHAVVHGGAHESHGAHEGPVEKGATPPLGPPPPPEKNTCEVPIPFIIQG